MKDKFKWDKDILAMAAGTVWLGKVREKNTRATKIDRKFKDKVANPYKEAKLMR